MKFFRTTHRIVKFQSAKVIYLSFSFLNVSTFFSRGGNWIIPPLTLSATTSPSMGVAKIQKCCNRT